MLLPLCKMQSCLSSVRSPLIYQASSPDTPFLASLSQTRGLPLTRPPAASGVLLIRCVVLSLPQWNGPLQAGAAQLYIPPPRPTPPLEVLIKCMSKEEVSGQGLLLKPHAWSWVTVTDKSGGGDSLFYTLGSQVLYWALSCERVAHMLTQHQGSFQRPPELKPSPGRLL